ncbi:hypothetical protein BDE02_04G166100 [Populus trichocarpa]|nr:hypothetical protein BDE02_04G166100 [Populus trichocarpa]
MWVFLLMMSLLLCPVAASTARPDVKPGCQDKCGDVSVPYPFGIGEQSCAMNKPFFLNCTSGTDGQPELLIGTIRVHNISVLEGTVTVGIYAAFDCYKKNREQNRQILSAYQTWIRPLHVLRHPKCIHSYWL